MKITMDQLRPGQRGTVTQIEVDTPLQKRLRDLGMISGTQVYCRYRSPGGSVGAFEFRGTVIALRTADVKRVGVSC